MSVQVEYARNIIVAVVFRGEWRWYISDKELWFLDAIKLGEAFRQRGYGGTGSSQYKYRFGIAVVNEETADRFLDHMEPYRVDRLVLRTLILERLPISSWDDIIDLCPSLLVDFDGKRLLSLFPEPASFEDFVPAGWSGMYEDFLAEVPEEERYWVVNGHDYFAQVLHA